MSQTSQRVRLFNEDPHCFWCGCITTLNTTNPRLPTLATVEHLYSRQHPARRDKKHLKVLACFSCNQRRNNCEHKGIPFTPKLPERLQVAQQTWAPIDRRGRLLAHARKRIAKPVPLTPNGGGRDLRMAMRIICTLEEAVAFARENPAR